MIKRTKITETTIEYTQSITMTRAQITTTKKATECKHKETNLEISLKGSELNPANPTTDSEN